MTTIINQAVTAIVAALQASPAVATSIGRINLRPTAQALTHAVMVRPLGSEVIEASMISSLPMTWTTTIAVECHARTTGATSADVAVDALLESVYARLMADPSLGGVVLGLQPQNVSFDFDADGDKPACAPLVLHARHRATPGTLT